MSIDKEKIKAFVALKEKIEQKIERLRVELDENQMLIETIDHILTDKGFQRATISEDLTRTPDKKKVDKVVPSSKGEKIETIPLRNMSGDLLAKLYLGKNLLRIKIEEGLNLDSDIPPFNQFFLDRVLEKMVEKDKKRVHQGLLTSEKMFSYQIEKDGKTLREIIVKNFDITRLRELKSSIRWTLQKMYDKRIQ